jgi:alpha-N-arabinofuranosidase
MDAHNSFADPEAIQEAKFTSATLANGTLQLTLPAKSIITISLAN